MAHEVSSLRSPLMIGSRPVIIEPGGYWLTLHLISVVACSDIRIYGSQGGFVEKTAYATRPPRWIHRTFLRTKNAGEPTRRTAPYETAGAGNVS